MSAHPDYQAFLKAKVRIAPALGFEVAAEDVNPLLKPMTRAIVPWACRGGRRALFLRFGLHKTSTQLEVIRQCLIHAGGHGLIVVPLGVRHEFFLEVEARHPDIRLKFIRSAAELEAPNEPGSRQVVIHLTNYETIRDGKLDPLLFTAASLDEAACLRGFGGTKTFREFMATFAGDDLKAGRKHAGVRYRFVATAVPDPNEFIELLAYAAFLGVMDVGEAKAQPLDAKVLTPDGWRAMGSIQVGDEVIARDGKPTRVLGVYPQGERPVFRVRFSDGSSTECDGEHLWFTRTQYERNNEQRYLGRNGADAPRAGAFGSVRTTAEIAQTLTGPGGSNKNHSIPVVAPVEFASRKVQVDPWLLGLLIGDGCLRETSITLSTADTWVVDRANEIVAGHGLTLTKTAEQRRDGSPCYDYLISAGIGRGGRGPGSNPILGALRDYGLLGKRAWEKGVPDLYLRNSIDVRLAVLRGLMDADGSTENGRTQSITTTSPKLAEDIVFLVRSLGGVATMRAVSSVGRPAIKVVVSLPVNPFSLPRKAEKVKPKSKYPPRRYIVAVEPAGTKPVQCIAVEHPDRLYVTDDFIVTHNTRFFKRDSEHADKLTLHPHKEEEFWLWVSSWALFVQKPSDLGFSDEGYDLPPLDIRWHEIPSDHTAAGEEKDGQLRLLANSAHGVSEAAREKRLSLEGRIAKMMTIRAEEPDAHRLIWHDLETERAAIERAAPEVVSVWGSLDLDERERRVIRFARGEFAELATKPMINGAGCNFQQHCAWGIYLGIGFKFHDFIQSVFRIQRFGQTRAVRLDLIYTEAEREMRRTLERRWRQFDEQAQRMSAIIRRFGLAEQAAVAGALGRSMGVVRQEARGEGYLVVHNDTVEETRTMQADSVDLIVTSIPFSTQYEYTPSFNDFGHTDDDAHFWAQMDFLTPELLRILKPGRTAIIHVKDRIVPGGINGLGFQTVNPFSDDCIAHFRKHGFAFMARITIATDVVRENAGSYRLGWTEQCKDGTRHGRGLPEYVLEFRKPPSDRSNGYADVPVMKEKPPCFADHLEQPDKAAPVGEGVRLVPFDRRLRPVPGPGFSRARWQIDAHGVWRSSGDRPLLPDELRALARGDQKAIYRGWKAFSLSQVYDHATHVEFCEVLDAEGKLPPEFMLAPPHVEHPAIRTDVARMRTLNMLQQRKGREMHLCPLQFDIVERAIEDFSMSGETVFDPFGGIMTVPYCALRMGRKAIGVELNPDYWRDGVAYAQAAAAGGSGPTLFDYLSAAGSEAAE